jgi:hypothetical protein
MVMFASQVSQQIYQSQLSMAQQSQNAQMLSAQMGLMPHMGAMSAMSTGQTGIYGEQVAGRLANTGRTMMGMAGLGLGVAGALTGMPLDPFSAAISGGRMGFAAAGMGGAVGGAALAAAPFMAASAMASVYGGAFHGGMQAQAQTNSVLRSSFNFQGGQGAMGRGFSQQQMGQVGNLIQQEVGRMPFSSSQEMNQLIMQGSESGMFSAVRDVESFTKRFRSMLDGLRKIQKELGGTLSEALQFTRGAQQLGIFTSGGRASFASEMRDTMTATGMDQTQLFSLAATGSMLSRATGGVGRQGALGAVRTARMLGNAVQTGAINPELLSEATGGLQGEEAIQAFTARSMQMTDRFSRTARGRYSLFSLSNTEGTGLDAAALSRFRAGDISVGSVMRDAHTRVNRMGRARALNQEGHLRGAMMEEGGLSGQLGMLRLQLGDRALEGGDDLAQLVIQRRTGASQQESRLLTSLMRNQTQIMNTEDVNRVAGRRDVERQQEIRMNRSLESFMANLEHGLQDMTGVTSARNLGRSFLTKLSSSVERAMNNFLGIEGQALNQGEQSAMIRMGSGMATSRDRQRLAFLGSDTASTDSLKDLFRESTSHSILSAMGIHTPQTYGAMMDSRGVNLRTMGARERATAERARVAAAAGVINPESVEDMTGMQNLGARDTSGVIRQMHLAQMAGGRNGVYSAFAGTSANAVDAYAYRHGFGLQAADFTQGTTGPNRARAIAEATGGGALAGAILGGVAGSALGPIGTVGGALIGGALGGMGLGGLEFLNTPETRQDRALGFIARGGHAGREAVGAVTRQQLQGRHGGGGIAKQNVSFEQMALAKALEKDIDPQTIRTVLEGETFKNAIRRLPGMSGRAASQELTSLEQAVSNMKDPEQQRAAGVMVEQLRRNMKKNNGRIGAEWSEALNDRAKGDEARQMRVDMLSQYDKMSEALKNESGRGSMGALREAISSVGNALFSGGDKTFENVTGGTTASAAAISNMTPDELARVQDLIGGTEYGKNLISVGIQRQGAMKQMSGAGRRGRAGAADSIFGAATGNSLGEMDLQLGGRDLSKRNQAQVLYREFQRGGKGADELEKQVAQKLKAMGVENAAENIHTVRTSIESDKKVTAEEGGKLFDKLAFDEDLQKVQREGVKRAQEKADPLGVQRNDLLGKILSAVNNTTTAVAEAAGGPPKLQSG